MWLVFLFTPVFRWEYLMKNKNIKFVLGFCSVLIILIYVITKIFLIEIYDYLTNEISLVIKLVKVS